MTRYDVAVIGLGGAGLACLSVLSRRGLRAVGIDRHRAAGSGCSSRSHRGFRQAYFVDDLYVKLAQRAHSLWKELETETQHTLLEITGALQIGPEDHPAVGGVLRSCQRNGLPGQRLEVADARRRFPALRPEFLERWAVVLEEKAGILNADRCNQVQLELALSAGSTVLESTAVAAIRPARDCVRLAVADGESLAADHLILCPGYGINEILGAIEGGSWLPELKVQQQAELYFDIEEEGPFSTLPPPLSCITSEGPYSLVPPRGGEGLKVFRQHPPLPEDDDPELLSFVADALNGGERLSVHRRHVNREAVTSDRHPLVGEHPELRRILMVAGLSGHGYKFTPVFAEMIADWICSRIRLPGLFAPSRF